MGPVPSAVDMTDDKAGMAGYPRNTLVSGSSFLESLCTSFWPVLPSPLGVGCRQRTNLDPEVQSASRV